MTGSTKGASAKKTKQDAADKLATNAKARKRKSAQGAEAEQSTLCAATEETQAGAE